MFVELSVRPNGIAIISLNRPEKGNAFHGPSLKDFATVLNEIDQNPGIRLVILEGKGKHFCTGADLEWMQQFCQRDREDNLSQAKAMEKLFRNLHEMRPPLIASVHGSVFGGGLGLVACCDAVVAHPDSNFCFSELKLGLIPAVISPYLIMKIGLSQARFLMLTTQKFDAQEARRIGLIHLISDDTEQTIQKLTQQILTTAPYASAQCRKLLRTLPGMNLEQASKLTSSLIARARCSAEGQEGILTHLQKQQARWSPPHE